MLLVVTYSQAARQTLRNVCRAHEDAVVRDLGRAALLEESAFAAFQACRLRERYGTAVQVERTRPFNEFAAVDDEVRNAAAAYADREQATTPYDRFASGRDLPSQAELKEREL